MSEQGEMFKIFIFSVFSRSSTSLCFYDWESAQLVRRIEISAKHVYWSDSAEMVVIAGDESFYVLKVTDTDQRP